MAYCTQCAHPLIEEIPPGDDRVRGVCPECGYIHYQNPRLVVGSVIDRDGKVLLCRRSIEPRYGLWTVPAGYMETGETVADAARREAHEEACANIDIIAPYALLNLTFVSQVYFMFRARLPDGKFAAGHESLDARLFDEHEIPWDDLAFSSVRETLRLYFADRPGGRFPFHMLDVTR